MNKMTQYGNFMFEREIYQQNLQVTNQLGLTICRMIYHIFLALKPLGQRNMECS